MRKFNILLSLLSILVVSCEVNEFKFLDEENINSSNSGGIHIYGAAEDYDIKRVTTKADGSELPADSFISEMTMFVFDKNGNIIQGYTSRNIIAVDNNGLPTSIEFDEENKCSSAINIQKANPTFLIDTKDGIIASLDEASPRVIYYDNLVTTNALSECKIYIVANAWHKLEGILNTINTISDLESITIDIDANMSMPKKDDNHYRGFPMIGTHNGQTFDLSKNGNNRGAVAKIPLKKLYAKINFTMQINATQVVANQIPKFDIEKVEIFNVPKKARLGRALDSNGKPTYGGTNADDYIVEMVGNSSYNPDDYYNFSTEPFVINEFSRKSIRHSTAVNHTSGSEYLIEFGFYMPEHKVTPNKNRTNYSYPANIPDDLKQYYKPELVGAVRNDDGTTTNSKYATFARIHGSYTDHNGQIKTVRYDIYLGQDNTDNFTVKRNQLLNNKLVITGLTNYHDAYDDVQGNISIDHRVDVDYKGFNLSMERTAILDAHFEVRPLDIELSPNSTMKITIPETYRSWIAMENDSKARDTKDANTYINTTDDRKGVRKYFTNGLVSELTAANGGTIELKHDGEGSKIFRIWFYIDENPNVYDKLFGVELNSSPSDGYTVYGKNHDNPMYRNCPVEFKYYGTDNENTGGEAATVTKTVSVNFQQWNLWRVWNKDRNRFYDIEHEEEYLNNYASDEKYGQTQNGMVFGLDGIQLSYKYPSLIVKQNVSGIVGSIIELIKSWFSLESMADLANKIFADSDKAIHYDFYLSRDAETILSGISGSSSDITSKLTLRDYQGYQMNVDIATVLRTNSDNKTKIDGITLIEDPQSAFAYCYHKNKRNTNGNVEEQKWFLPAIDEIEDIAEGAYDEFDRVFQKNKYWSCQPAYELREMNLSILQKKLLSSGYNTEGSLNGNYFIDKKDRARATSIEIKIENGVQIPVNINSSAPGKYGTQYGQAVFNWLLTQYDESNSKLTTFTNANPAIMESDYAKVPGNLPRTQICRIRAVYRSGSVVNN